MSGVAQNQNHYHVLGLTIRSQQHSSLSSDEIKTAYRIALLRNHPDKITLKNTRPASPYTVDQITQAYTVLSDPSARKAYDKTRAAGLETPGLKPVNGFDKFDLDELEYDESQKTWFRGCRCGLKQGYVVSEEDLEREAEHGEVVMGCRGCSLCILVTFALAEG